MITNRKILYAEDEIAARQLFEGILVPKRPAKEVSPAGQWGLDELDLFGEEESFSPEYELFLAADGEQALEILDQQLEAGPPIAVVFFDYYMPKMDGYTAISHACQRDPRLHCVIVTGDQEIIEEARALFPPERQDQFLFIEKPYTVEELRQVAFHMVSSWNRKRNEEDLLRSVEEKNQRLKEWMRLHQEVIDELKQSNMTGLMASRFLHRLTLATRSPVKKLRAGFAELRATPLAEEQQRHLASAAAAAEQLELAIKGIIEFAECHSKEVGGQGQPFRLRELLSSLAAEAAARAAAKGLAFYRSVDEQVPEKLSGCPGRLRQVLLILLDNAVKFTEAGSIELQVGLQDDPGGEPQPGSLFLHYMVKDTGVGIGPEKQEQLLRHLYFSGDTESEEPEPEPEKMGLLLASHFCRELGGELWVESSEGRGAAFHFTARCLRQSEEEIGGAEL